VKVLHVEAGRHLYGGARQVLYIIDGLAGRGVNNVLACEHGSEIASLAGKTSQVVTMAMGGDADAILALRLRRLMVQLRPDLVHLHSRRGADLWGGVASRLAGVPCIVSRRVDNPEPRWLASAKYSLYDHVITISKAIREVLIAQGVDARKITCVRSAVDPAPYLAEVDRAELCREFQLPRDALLVAMVAQLIPRKGHRTLFAALPGLRAQFPRLRVLLFGKGPLAAELQAEIDAHGLREVVHLTGFRDDLARWLGGVDVLVHPADMEGLGVALLQAAAAAVPVIASRVGGLPEAVADGITGLLVPPGKPEALSVAMRRLLADAPLRRKMGQAGRARVMSEFSIEAMVQGNLAVYGQVLACREARRAPR
jgi:glycosyltransferase involved in cell wall biosynthesis